MRSVLWFVVLWSISPLIRADCSSTNDPTHPCRYPQGDSWCRENGKPPYAYKTKCSASPLSPSSQGSQSNGPSPQLQSNTYTAVTTDWTPNETDIRNALQRELDGRIARLDALAAQCNNLRDGQNLAAGLMCLASGGGMVTSKTFSAQVNSIALDECVRSNAGVAYCRYRPNTTMSGAGLMGQMADFANALSSIGGWTYSSFVSHGGTWHFQKTYDDCSWGDGGINCRWTERR
jgi:hypothetical protein